MKYQTKFGAEVRQFSIERHGDALQARCGDRTFQLDLALVGDGDTFSLLVDGRSYDVIADLQREQVTLQMLGERFVVHVEDEREQAAHAAAAHQGGRAELRAAMPGIVVDIKVQEGATVAVGDTLVVLEAMKMQNPLAAESAGKVTRILCKKGEPVAGGALLLELE